MTRRSLRLVTLLSVLLVALLAIPYTRSLLLLQRPESAALPFLFPLVGGLAPLAASLWSRLRGLDWLAATRLGESLVWALLGVMILLETLLDPQLTRWLGYDLTPIMRDFEGDLVARIQDATRSAPLDWTLALIYSYGFAFLYGFLPGLLLLLRDGALARAVLRALVLVWAVGLPAYLFLPVDEPWSAGVGVENVLHEVMPPSADQALVAASINNEFPSLHTAHSLAIGATLFGLRRRLFWWLSPAILGVPLATVYLGVHWVADLVSGIALGLGAAALGPRMPWFRTGEASENRYKDDPLAPARVDR